MTGPDGDVYCSHLVSFTSPDHWSFPQAPSFQCGKARHMTQPHVIPSAWEEPTWARPLLHFVSQTLKLSITAMHPFAPEIRNPG